MRIIHFISGIKGGGVESFLINYTSRMNKADPEMQEYVAYQHAPEKKCLSKLEAAGNICIQVPDKRKHPIANVVASVQLIRRLHPDVVHCHQSLLNFFPLLAATIAGVNVRISHAHIAHDNAGPHMFVNMYKRLTKLFATDLVACGHDAGTYLYGRTNFTVIENAINANQFTFSKLARDKMRCQLGISSSTLLIGHIGRFVEQKNHVRLIKIFSVFHQKHPASKLILIGDGPLVEPIKELIAQLGLKSDVHLIGAVGNPAPYYSAFDVMVFPSLYEGLPITMVEAQFADLPVVASSEIDSDVRFNKSTTFENLNSDNEQWAQKIYVAISSAHVNRKKILNSDYNIIDAYTKLPRFYETALARFD